jgi:hypothetical protein
VSRRFGPNASSTYDPSICKPPSSTDDFTDPGWAPASYWPALPSDEDLVQRVNGARRREELRKALASGDFSAIDPAVLRERLTAQERRELMRAAPHLALGEYLPELEGADLPQGEVEVCRLYLASGIGNTISVRGRRETEVILFRAVDEFEDCLSIEPAQTERPLTNSELLKAVKTLEWRGPLTKGPVWSTRDFEAEVDLERAADFITGDSEMYPAFADLIDADNEQWLEDQRETLDLDDDC